MIKIQWIDTKAAIRWSFEYVNQYMIIMIFIFFNIKNKTR